MSDNDDHSPNEPLEPDYRTLEHGPRRGETIVFLHGANAAGWTWAMQVDGLPDRHLLTPDLPGYAGRSGEDWPGLEGAADDVADLIRRSGLDGRAHVVGLSLGGFVATHLVRRHPELVRSCLITGSALTGYSRVERVVISAQVPLWRQGWYWTANAFAFRIPGDSRGQFVRDASAPSARSNRRMAEQVLPHRLPGDGYTFDGPLLAVAAEHDSDSVARAFPALEAVLPQTRTWVAPAVHHAWNAEDPELFNRLVAEFVDTGRWSGDR